MATTIFRDTTVIKPVLVLGYMSSRESRNIVHRVIGRGDPGVTFAPAALRTGTLQLLVNTLSEALTLDQLHATPGTITFADSDLPNLNMGYVADGAITVELDDESRRMWLVSIDFTETETPVFVTDPLMIYPGALLYPGASTYPVTDSTKDAAFYPVAA